MPIKRFNGWVLDYVSAVQFYKLKDTKWQHNLLFLEFYVIMSDISNTITVYGSN